MGKAGRWIVNFLVGKKEENHMKKKKKKMKKIGSSSSSSFSDSENLKLKWSFRKTTSTATNLLTHRISKSVDSIEAPKKEAMTELKKPPSGVQNAAATTIQSAYRSHLARKALHALRGLVKIQALVRGHLVRKQTAATLKSLQALMAIQVRARANRIHLLEEEEELLERRRQHRHLVNTHFEKERLYMNLDEPWKPYKSKSGYLSRTRIEQIENESNPCSCRRNLSIPKRRHRHENYCISAEPSTSKYYVLVSKPTAEKASFSMHQARHSDCVPHDHPFYPNYMAKTESSRAKVRSHSEPKQRPGSSTRPKSKQTEIVGRMSLPVSNQIQSSLENPKHNGCESHNHPWFMKLYQLTRTSKNKDSDSTSSKLSRPDDPP